MSEEDNWLERSLKSASAEVAKWPEWKKKAMRVMTTHPPQPLGPHLEALLTVADYVPPPETWLTPERKLKLQERALELLALEPNWYESYSGYDGEKIRRKAVLKALEIVNSLGEHLPDWYEIRLYPTIPGGVQIEVGTQHSAMTFDIEVKPKAKKFITCYEGHCQVHNSVNALVKDTLSTFGVYL